MGFRYIFLLLLLPSQSSLSYRIYDLHKLCEDRSFGYTDILYHREATNIIELNENPSMSSVLIEQAWDNSTYKQFQNCEFKVKTPTKWFYGTYGSTSGMFVAIRELNFRRNAIGECLDYLIFELSGINPASHKICGEISGDEGLQDVKNYFEIPSGFIKIIVHIDKHVLGRSEIEMKLTFTAFDDCTGSYKFRCRNYRCISSNLYDDAIINCIPPLCADEPRHFSKCGANSSFYPTNILAICSSLVFVVFASSMCYYFLKLFLVRCGVREIDDQFAPVVEYRSVPIPVLTAPDDTLSESQISSDDPPSYESLFMSN